MNLKTPQEIKKMHAGGQKLAGILRRLQAMALPGVSLLEIEARAIELIHQSGCTPSFTRVPGYRWATCLNINDGFVHGIPKAYTIRKGDVVSIDVGVFYQGFHTDTSVTFQAGSLINQAANDKIQLFLTTGQKVLQQALDVIKPGQRIWHISRAIQTGIEQAGYSVSLTLTGHGVGRTLHEPPKIPCFTYEKPEQTPLIEPGMTLAIEVLYLAGRPAVVTDSDGWTIKSKDGKITGVFEKTIAVTGGGYIILT
jgi:methionyl aminopeptidase